MSNDTTRDAFEAHATPMGFDLTRQYLAVPEPWSEYICPDTGYFWAGWQAATEQGKRQPLTDEQWVQTELFKLAIKKGLLTVHTELVATPQTDPKTKVSWLAGHAGFCDISNEAAHGITTTPQGKI